MAHLSDIAPNNLSRPGAVCVRGFRSVENCDAGLNGRQRRAKLMRKHCEKLFLVMLSLVEATSHLQQFCRCLSFFKMQHGVFRQRFQCRSL
jgi:hypothetical protein